jgi:uncharacterized protein
MLETIKQLLILQDRDRKILQIQAELAGFEMQRKALHSKSDQSQASLDSTKLKLKHIETERKKLELEVEAKKQMIERYSLQQFQTKKNEEYRALAHEIETCKSAIRELEDQELELMEQAELVQKELAGFIQQSKEIQSLVASQTSQLAARELNLRSQRESLIAERTGLAEVVEEGMRQRYERLLKQRGDKVLVGIDHGVCAGCHMKLPPQVVLSCQTDEGIVNCPNCGRILFFTSEMDLATSD